MKELLVKYAMQKNKLIKAKVKLEGGFDFDFYLSFSKISDNYKYMELKNKKLELDSKNLDIYNRIKNKEELEKIAKIATEEEEELEKNIESINLEELSKTIELVIETEQNMINVMLKPEKISEISYYLMDILLDNKGDKIFDYETEQDRELFYNVFSPSDLVEIINTITDLTTKKDNDIFDKSKKK